MKERRVPFVQSVFLPIDFEGGSEQAFAHALAIALVGKTSLKLFHAGSQPELEWHRFPAVRRTLERWGLLKANSERKAVFDELSVRVTKAYARGEPGRACLREIAETKPDLVVMATNGREGLARWLHPSIAARVGRRSNTIALFVPSEGRGFVAPSDGYLSLRRILIPVDETPNPASAFAWATRIAETLGEAPVAIQVLGVNRAPELPSQLESEAWKVEPLTRKGDVIEEILGVAGEADLVIMPTDGRDGVLDIFRGGHTERVLRGAPCPILAVPSV
jgi:nucleotide-binding universal stress UspA family protein